MEFRMNYAGHGGVLIDNLDSLGEAYPYQLSAIYEFTQHQIKWNMHRKLFIWIPDNLDAMSPVVTHFLQGVPPRLVKELTFDASLIMLRIDLLRSAV